MKFRNLVWNCCAIRRLIVVWSSILQQWMTTGVSILAGLHCLIVGNDFLFRFVHKMVGARSSARPPGQIKPGKLWKVFFTPGFLYCLHGFVAVCPRGVRIGQHNREGDGFLTFLGYIFM